MTVEQREAEEGAPYKEQLIQKMESYLRERFDSKSASAKDGAMEMLLWQIGKDWLINRGLPANEGLLREAVEEAAMRYRRNWDGKEQGEDDRSHALGRRLKGEVKGYGI